MRTDCDLAADCTHSYHSVHCIDESCQCAYAPAINLGMPPYFGGLRQDKTETRRPAQLQKLASLEILDIQV